MRTGANYLRNGRSEFVVWAPLSNDMAVKLISPLERIIPMEKDHRGYWITEVDDVFPGTLYLYKLENSIERPDPASRFQPDGVHGPSQVIDPYDFLWWDDDWKGIPLGDFIIYELHVGTFTKEGTFKAILQHLKYLKELGITAIELMPIAQFPGSRNWGYDGVYLFAPQNSYGGGPYELKTLVNACHKEGFAVILDVVYNHLGPEGNYLNDFGPYFTDRYKTPWGDAINFDGPYSDEVRRFFIKNALYWITEYHFDALRIDAIHGIFDFSAKHFLQELGEVVHAQAEKLERRVYIIPESDLNDVRVINPFEIGGYGLDAQWNDDFHHALHTLLTGENNGYFEDFGTIGHMEKAFKEGFVYSGQYSNFRKRKHGSFSKKRPAHQFVVFSQNHDQVGNRLSGNRLSATQSLEKLKLAAGVVILSPFIPLLFMGEEYGEKSPFQYFVSHSDEDLIEAVRKGRRDEFASFQWEGEIPDPQAESTFLNSKIHIELRHHGEHNILFEFYKKLIKLRKEISSLCNLNNETMEVKGFEEGKTLFLRRWFRDDEVFCIYNFNNEKVKTVLNISEGIWNKILDSSSREWGGSGGSTEHKIESFGSEILISLTPHSFVLYRMSKGVE
ncbi:MAG: malto-oligosyltrehalose trehalohydrolase [Nitrospirota bacterium]|nr:malto-oligosyltrehalose trehalohydrolase [Nitrospirota bacterium]